MKTEHWEAYYRDGKLATGPAGSDGGYDLEVRDAWVGFFSTLPDAARILDVGTGNGAVAMIAAQTAAARGLKWDIHATDLARIDPLRDVRDGARRLAGIAFHPEAATEALPFDDAGFDAVSGHYALEYTHVPAALAEVHRVLKPGGDAQFVLHHADSVLVTSARSALEEAAFVLGENRIHRHLHRLLTLADTDTELVQKATDDVRAAIHGLKTGMELLREAGGGRVLAATLEEAQRLLARRRDGGMDGIGAAVDEAEAGLRASVLQLNDLLVRSRDEDGMRKLGDEATAAGFSLVEWTPLSHAGDHLVGWQLLMHRA